LKNGLKKVNKNEKRLLILEDDVAKHGEEVLNLTAENKYDLYIFNINVPYINGLTLLQEVLSSGDTTAAIFFTNTADPHERSGRCTRNNTYELFEQLKTL